MQKSEFSVPEDDPRIARTRGHVLSVTRQLLAEAGPASVTVSSVAARAQVSRQTIYRYWPSTETLIASAVLRGYQGAHPQPADSVDEIITLWLDSLRGAMSEVWRASALANVFASAAHDPQTGEILDRILEDRQKALAELLTPLGVSCSTDDFMMLTGPVLFSQMFLRQPASDELLERLKRAALAALTSASA